MLRAFSATNRTMKEISKEEPLSKEIWYDLLNPTTDEIQKVEKELNLSIPTNEEMREIESSSRFYQENDFFYMTINLLAKAETDLPISSPVTFILNEKQLVTLRYTDPKPFNTFIKRAQKNFKTEISSHLLFFGLLETIVDRIADIIETIGMEIDSISHEIFRIRESKSDQIALKEIVTQIGKKGDLSAQTRLSLENFQRLLKFVNNHLLTPEMVVQYKNLLDVLQQDVTSITDHIAFLFHKNNFLLDATLGLISIEQNTIVKIFSIVAVIFLPPTLIASIYGMNFIRIPELHFAFGYPLALMLIILSAVLPYLYFKRKGWL